MWRTRIDSLPNLLFLLGGVSGSLTVYMFINVTAHGSFLLELLFSGLIFGTALGLGFLRYSLSGHLVIPLKQWVPACLCFALALPLTPATCFGGVLLLDSLYLDPGAGAELLPFLMGGSMAACLGIILRLFSKFWHKKSLILLLAAGTTIPVLLFFSTFWLMILLPLWEAIIGAALGHWIVAWNTHLEVRNSAGHWL